MRPMIVSLKLALGVGLCIGGVFFAYNHTVKLPNTAQAQRAGQYSSKWIATKLLVLHRKTTPVTSSEGPNYTVTGPSFEDEIAIGPAEWQVKGSLSDGTAYKEVWSLPADLPAMRFRGNSGRSSGDSSFQGVEVNISEASKSLWILSLLAPHEVYLSGHILTEISFQTKDRNAGINNFNYDNTNIGLATSWPRVGLGLDWHTSLIATSPYSFSMPYNYGANDSKYVSMGVVAPVRWNITGKICPDPVSCQ